MVEAPFDAIPSAANFADYFTTPWLESFQYSCGIIGKQAIELLMQQKVGIRKLINTVNHPHPDVYSAVAILKREQETTEL